MKALWTEYFPHLSGSGKKAAIGAEKVDIEVGEGTLGQVEEGGGELTCAEVGSNRAKELDVGGEAVCRKEEAVAITGLGFKQVDKAWDRLGQGGAVESDGAYL